MRKAIRKNLVQIGPSVAPWRELPRKKRSEPKRAEKPVEEMSSPDPWPGIEAQIDLIDMLATLQPRHREALIDVLHSLSARESASRSGVSARQIEKLRAAARAVLQGTFPE